MSYSKSLLGKEVHELSYQDIVNYFQETKTESNIAEYKSYNSQGNIDAKLPGLYKAVCALLNSQGGILIWGAPKGSSVQGRKEKDFVGELTPINRIIEHDWLINKLSDNITPIPIVLKGNPIPSKNSCVVILEVEKSPHAPHQTGNGYYMRLDGQTRPAPHHFVEALFKQVKFPDLGGYIKFLNYSPGRNELFVTLRVIIMNHSPLLNEENTSFRLMCPNGIIDVRRTPQNNHLNFDGGIVSLRSNVVLHYGSAEYTDITVQFDPEIEIRPFVSEFHLLFGGKKSPQKVSIYNLSLTEFGDINNSNVERTENTLHYEYAKEKGSEIEKVNILLNR